MNNQENYQKRLFFEHDLINRRLTWLLTSQTILFAALAFVLGKEELSVQQSFFSEIISILGMGISIAILIGVLMGILAKVMTWRDAKAIDKNQQFGVRTWITMIAFIPDVFMPIAFAIAWYCIWAAIG